VPEIATLPSSSCPRRASRHASRPSLARYRSRRCTSGRHQRTRWPISAGGPRGADEIDAKPIVVYCRPHLTDRESQAVSRFMVSAQCPALRPLRRRGDGVGRRHSAGGRNWEVGIQNLEFGRHSPSTSHPNSFSASRRRARGLLFSVGALFQLWIGIVLGCGVDYWLFAWSSPRIALMETRTVPVRHRRRRLSCRQCIRAVNRDLDRLRRHRGRRESPAESPC